MAVWFWGDHQQFCISMYDMYLISYELFMPLLVHRGFILCLAVVIRSGKSWEG